MAFYVARLVPPAVALHTPASGAGEAQRWAAHLARDDGRIWLLPAEASALLALYRNQVVSVLYSFCGTMLASFYYLS